MDGFLRLNHSEVELAFLDTFLKYSPLNAARCDGASPDGRQALFSSRFKNRFQIGRIVKGRGCVHGLTINTGGATE